jgi:hypothetical protein
MAFCSPHVSVRINAAALQAEYLHRYIGSMIAEGASRLGDGIALILKR